MSARDVIAEELFGLVTDTKDERTNAADAILSALSAAGWVVVPREPTKAMVHAAADGCAPNTMRAIYRAMIAAALPAAPEARDDGGAA